jgi:hypothetical protein
MTFVSGGSINLIVKGQVMKGIDRYAGYGGDDDDLFNCKTPTFYHSSDDVDSVVEAMKSHACDSQLTWWDVVDRANSSEKIIRMWREDYLDKAKDKWVKDYYWEATDN